MARTTTKKSIRTNRSDIFVLAGIVLTGVYIYTDNRGTDSTMKVCAERNKR